MQLKLTAKTASDEGDDDASLCGLAGGCCFDFSRLSEHLFLVGTEEGRIHKCSKAYNSAYLESYEGHYMAVYTVRLRVGLRVRVRVSPPRELIPSP